MSNYSFNGLGNRGATVAKCALVDCNNKTAGKNVCCSRACSNRFFPRRKKELRKCTRCKEKFPGHGTCPSCKDKILANKERFQQTTLFELTEAYETNGIHKSWRYSELRGDARRKTNFVACAVCGYTIHVEVCHIKAISSFPLTATVAEVNELVNLVGLCPNHHYEFDHGLITL